MQVFGGECGVLFGVLFFSGVFYSGHSYKWCLLRGCTATELATFQAAVAAYSGRDDATNNHYEQLGKQGIGIGAAHGATSKKSV